MSRVFVILFLLIGCSRQGAQVPEGDAPTTFADAVVPARWDIPLDEPLVVASDGMVATDRPLATTAGVEVLRNGGNAVDAAIATAFVMTVVNPAMADLGGGGFMVAWVAGDTGALDFRPTAPAAATRNMFIDSEGHLTDEGVTGHKAAGVPGLVAGLWEAQRRFGTRPWSELLAPAIKLADEGFELDSQFLRWVMSKSEQLARFNSSAALFLDNGEAPREGRVWRNPDMATTLRRIAERGRLDFYEGQTADLIVEEMQRGGGTITHGDLRGYEAKWREPIRFTYRDSEIVSMPPPASGGTVLAIMANILEGFDLGALGWHSPEALHLTVEAMRRAYAVRNSLLGDPDFVDIPVERLISKEYAAELRADISGAHATTSEAVSQDPESGAMHTTHISIVDRDGNAVALTSTVGGAFGSAVTVGGAGFTLNNLMDDFAARPGSPNRHGLVMGEANAIGPGKRPLSSITPVIVFGEDGLPMLISGAAGGSRITTSVFNILSNVLDYGMNVSAAVRAPRVHHQHLPDVVFLEEHGFSVEQVNGLRSLGHAVQESPIRGSAPSVMRWEGAWIGGGDPRVGAPAQGL